MVKSKKEMVLEIADGICLLDDESKIFVAGYIFGSIFNDETQKSILQKLMKRGTYE